MAAFPLTATLLLGTLAQAQPPIRTGTEAVQVDVRVMDQDGRFVPTLTKADFEIAEDGAPQEIVAVYLVSGGKVAGVADTADATPSASVAPAAATRQTWIFVFDSVHLTPGTLDRTRDAVVRFVQERFRDGDLAGIVANGRMIDNRLTSVRDELVKAVRSVNSSGGKRSRALDLREWPRLRDELEAIQIANGDRETIANVVRRACEEDPSMCRSGLDPETVVRSKGRRLTDEIRAETASSLVTVTALSSGLARVAGPKTVVFVSEGFIIERMESELRTAVGQAARSGARFYTIDARGLNRGSTADIIDQPLPDPGGAVRLDLQADGTTSLAVDTGGLAIRNHNDFGRALDLIARDADSYYVIGYRPANSAWDGKYRRIEVKVRTAGMKVRARRGYLALEPAQMLAVTPEASPPAPVRAEPAPPAPVLAEPAAMAPAPPPAMPAETPATPIPPAPPPIAPPAAGTRKNAAEMVLALADGAAGVKVTGAAAADGWAAYQRGDLETAAAIFRRAVAAGDSPPWVHYALGFAVLSQGAAAEAVAAWEKVRAEVPEFQAVYYDLADAYTQLRDEKMALLVLRDAERRWPSQPDLFNAMGVIQLRRGAIDGAIQSFEQAVKIAPQDALGYFNLGRAHEIRYTASLRYVEAIGRRVGSERDRERAVANLEKYIALGGPYVRQAREALAALAWK